MKKQLTDYSNKIRCNKNCWRSYWDDNSLETFVNCYATYIKVLMKYTWKNRYRRNQNFLCCKLMCKYWINIVKPTGHILLIPPIYCKPTATCFIFNDLFHELLEINWFAMTFFLRPGFNKTYMERNIRDEEGFKILINISKLVYCV